MAQGNNAQTIAYQVETYLKKVTDTIQRDSMLFDKIEKRPTEVMSTRVLWWAIDAMSGTKTRQIDPDGGQAGRGAAIVATRAQVTAPFFEAATELTDLAMSATDTTSRAVGDAQKRNMEKQVQQYRNMCESLLNQSDSNAAGVLDAITSISGTRLGVNNANKFQSQKDYQVLPAVGQPSRGTITTLTYDANANQIYCSSALPPGTIAGDLLVIDGSPGIVNNSAASIQSNHVDANTGAWNNIPRASFPGQFKTPHVAMNNFAATPQGIQLGIWRLRNVLPEDDGTSLDLLVHLGFDQAQSQTNYFNQGFTNGLYNEVKGNNALDMVKRLPADTLAGYPMLVSKLATPGRIDCLAIKKWFRGEIQPIGPLERGGQTIFQTYGDDGGLNYSVINYIWGGFQFCLEHPKYGLFFDGCALPSGFAAG